ncbi:hypothetical protein D7W82_08780 [Corallococcus sp. CA049B]|uniref:hypothetical protein n=1 Tax=Corallococcus sp. CA049B TaxID=2316730 RepID=UPI000EA0D342|nr:hypothetical protein [Corallococcus sp. CA049B]RKG88911.1 hypothetical protein D7W82_08780 [Corallococcus sp. CA049B]
MTFVLPVTENTEKPWNLLQTNLPETQVQCRIVDGRPVVFGLYLECTRVPDVVRYVLDLTDSPTARFSVPSPLLRGSAVPINGDQFAGDVRADDHAAEHKQIVLIIESPHRHEYTSAFTPIAPAQKTTGRNISTHIVSLLHDHQRLGLPPDHYELLICNPVQFQASLYEFHRQSLYKNDEAQSLRDTTWRTLYYGLNERAGFLSRLDRYDPAAVIVACTANLKQEVLGDVIRWASCRIPVVEASSHPSAWHSRSKVAFR